MRLQQTAVVTKVEGDRVWLKSHAQTACGTCVQYQSCGTAVFSSLFPQREWVMRSDLPVSVGESLSLELEACYLLLSSLVMYLLPLLTTVAGVMVLSQVPDLSALLPELALIMLLGSFALIHFLALPLMVKWVIFKRAFVVKGIE